MKNLLILLIISLTSKAIPAQNFEFPTAADSAVWTFLLYDDFGQLYGYGHSKMHDSTMVDGKWYSIVDGFDLIRTENNQVYILSQDSTEEYLLYDFDLEIGDTFIIKDDYLNVLPPLDTIIVSHIDSTLVGNEYRKVWHMNNYYALWIEGIGCTNSITHPNYWGSVSGGQGLLCYGENGEYILEGSSSIYNYDLGQYIPIGCDGFIINTEELLSANSIEIFPNPTSNFLQIKGLENKRNFTVKIFNLEGKLIQKENNISTILVSNLELGMYFLEIHFEDEKIKNRFVKN